MTTPMVKARWWKTFDEASSPAEARRGLEAIIADYRQAYPSAMGVIERDLDALVVHLRWPSEHRKRIRTANLLERTFVEVRRRTKVIGRFPGETSAPSLIWAVLPVVPLSLAVLAPSAMAARNVNFVGTWKVSSGVNFAITKENRKTGRCSGRTSLASSGYKLVSCRVRGRRYSFTVTYGASYRSRNSGTISGDKLRGTFRDTNGTVQSYTATRVHPPRHH